MPENHFHFSFHFIRGAAKGWGPGGPAWRQRRGVDLQAAVQRRGGHRALAAIRLLQPGSRRGPAAPAVRDHCRGFVIQEGWSAPSTRSGWVNRVARVARTKAQRVMPPRAPGLQLPGILVSWPFLPDRIGCLGVKLGRSLSHRKVKRAYSGPRSFQRTICRRMPCNICTSARVSGNRDQRLRRLSFIFAAL